MKSLRVAPLCFYLIISSLSLAQQIIAQPKGVGGSSFHKNDITYSTEVVTPHVAWGTKLAGGPIKGFFIPPVQYGRDMVELMQRISLQPTTVTIDRSWDINCWGIGDYYGHEYRGDRDDFRTVYGYAEKDLTGDAAFEVIMIPGLNGWSRLTRPTRDAILRRVSEGAGLVLLHPFKGDVKGHPFKGDEAEPDERIWDISPLVGVADDTVNERGYPDVNQEGIAKGKWEFAASHFITQGFPLELFPEGIAGGSFYKYSVGRSSNVIIKSGDYPVAAVKNYGKGRVVALGYLEEGFTPQSVNPTDAKIYWDYWEYQYSLLARSILWASGREVSVDIASLSANEKALKLSLSAKGRHSVEFEVTARSEFDSNPPPPRSHKLQKEIKTGNSEIEIALNTLKPAAGWAGGKQILDVRIRDAKTGDALNWGTTVFQTPKRANLTMVKPANDVYRGNETLSAVVRATGDLSGLQMRVKVSDDLGRFLSTDQNPARAERTFLHHLQNFLGKFALVTAELVDEKGVVIDQLRANPVTVVQETRRQREYTPLVSFGGTKHYLQNAQMRQVRAAAADTGFTWSGGGIDNSLNIPRGTFGVYWYDRGPTTPEGIERAIADYQKSGDLESLGYLTKKELYRRTGDKKYLRRTPSFNDSVFMKRLADIVRTTARNKARYQMDYYFVGDEGSLTSYGDAVDFDWSPQTLDEFRIWLKSEYKTLSALNKEWKTSFKSWDEVIPLTTEEARKSGNFAPWADHRTFMEITFAKAYQIVRDAVIEGDPQGHIALSGTQSTNAYNGADWSRLDQVIDDFLSYDGGNQWDLHRSFAKPGAQIGFWTGYGSNGVAVKNAVWTAATNNVLHPNVFWMYSFLNPDLTHSKSARDMGEAFNALKYEGVGRLLMESEKINDGIAIHYSMSSVHGASILGYHRRSGDDGDSQAKEKESESFNFPANRDGWVQAVKDLGLQFNFVSSQQIEKDVLSSGKYKVLVLPFSIALSGKEIRAIEDFVRGGGTVITDADAGLMNDRCSWRKGSLDNLFGITSSAADKHRLNRTGGNISLTAEGTRWGLNSQEFANISLAGTDVVARRGKPLIRANSAPAVIVNRLGTGSAVYLNMLLDKYSKQRLGNNGAAYRTLLKTFFERAGVRPAVQVTTAEGKPLTQFQTARYQFGESEIFVLVKDHAATEGAVGQDGVTVYTDTGGTSATKQNVIIRFPRNSYVADVRSGKIFGLTNSVSISVMSGDAIVLGLDKARKNLALSGPNQAKPGEHVEFNINSALSSQRLLRCVFFAPDGSPIRAYQKNVLFKNQKAKVVFPTALNDPAGEYTVRITDIVSGVTGERKISLK